MGEVSRTRDERLGRDVAIRVLPAGFAADPERLAKLRSLTNLRAVRDPASDTGWRVEIGPFPGWGTVPELQ
jgi:hypothetical protein